MRFSLIHEVARRRPRVVAILFLLALGSAAKSEGVQARLSADGRPANFDSTYGSGNFGTWHVDRFGLPAFRYDADEQGDLRAQQPELAGATEAQHQLGNDHVVAAAFNHGYTQLWSQDRLSQWANLYEPASRHWAGGYGYLVVDDTVTSTLWLDHGDAASRERDFGVGYFRKALGTAGVDVEQVVYAPFGDDPLLLDDVTITNRTAALQTVSWFEYWDVNPYDQTGQVRRGVGQPVWDPAIQTLSVAQSGGHVDDPAPLSLFAAALQGPLDGFETSAGTFFGEGTRAAPAEVVAGHLSGTLAPPSPPGAAGGALFVFHAPLVLASGQTVTLRYAYGMAHADQIGALVAKYRAQSDPLGDSERAWASWLPKADFGRTRRWVARELAWDAYLLRSASVYEEVCGHHTITQGGYYQYFTGLNLGFRSWPHYLLPITYTAPELAREILRYTIGLQPQTDNRFAYGTGPLCSLFSLGTSSDLDFWLLLAAAEYGLGSRDRAFFSEPIPFYDTKQPATAWEHIKLAYRHQETLRGPHGGYAAGTNGDWSDFSAPFLQMSESTLVGVQVAYAYPKLADLADRLGDHEFALELRARAAELRRVLRGEWTGRGWYPRGYGGDRQIGSGAIFGEPQPWAVLAGIPTRRQAKRLVANVRRFLGGVGAPPIVHGPSRIGSSLTPAHDDPDVTERSTMPVGVGDNNANYVGGVWFDVNGWLTWALGELDGVVPRARRFAWSEYVRNTLANHAIQFPDHWAGTISIDDTCYSYYSSHPERCGNDLYRQYDGQITEQPTWMVMDAIRLAGITPTEKGYRIAPHFPFTRFSLRLPRIGVARNGRGLRGYVRSEETGSIELRVRVPGGVAPGALETRANGHTVAHRIAGRFVVFRLRAVVGAAADWAIRWSGAG
jgi:Glycosyl hydrolase 36 superfamily, catalytic domain/Glycosyltransferase family 36